MTKSKFDKKKVIDIWKKLGDNKIISDVMYIPEEFVSDFIEFNKIPKNIKTHISFPYSLLRHSELMRLISKAVWLVQDGMQKNLKKPDNETIKLFNSSFEQFLKDSFEPLIHRSAHNRLVSWNNGKSCPECDSKKQAEKINDIEIIKNEVLKLAESLSKKNNVKLKPEYDPEWKCVDCDHEWRGANVTCFLDSDTI